MFFIAVSSKSTLPRSCLIVAHGAFRRQQMHDMVGVSLTHRWLEFSFPIFVAHEVLDLHVLVLWTITLKLRKLP